MDFGSYHVIDPEKCSVPPIRVKMESKIRALPMPLGLANRMGKIHRNSRPVETAIQEALAHLKGYRRKKEVVSDLVESLRFSSRF